MARKPDLFTPIVLEANLHPSFQVLRTSRLFAPARGTMREVFDTFDDVDGNFVEQFQTSGFNARVWELYLHACLSSSGFNVVRLAARPDFVAAKDDSEICVEAVTANPTQGEEAESPTASGEEIEHAVLHKQQNLLPIKLGSALYSKLQKRYWELDHVRGKPIVFAIENFSEAGSLIFSDSALMTYLYGYRHEWEHDSQGNLTVKPRRVETHVHGEKSVPSGFFFEPEGENISAVMFSNSGTVTKFGRMGQLGRHRCDSIRMVRVGTCYNPDPNAVAPMIFEYEIGDPDFPETWGQGLSICLNPKALNPLEAKELFPDAAVHEMDGGMIYSRVPDFHPFSSRTVTTPK
ncbi:MAG: glycosaminoglycan attachment protein [Candidatus Eisenbacteria sp.]|nr:glycosaminoglycan attachment protein [Candidatus Eisenbacteria bacterium]